MTAEEVWLDALTACKYDTLACEAGSTLAYCYRRILLNGHPLMASVSRKIGFIDLKTNTCMCE